MKSIVFYFATKKALVIGHDFTFVPLTPGGAGRYIRAEVVEGGVLTARDNAKPRPGETVLNTVPFEG